MLEQASILAGGLSEFGKSIANGMDFHQATVEAAKSQGVEITRYQAKTVNFLTIYGGGIGKLAGELGCPMAQATKIRQAIFSAAPEIESYIRSIQSAARDVGHITNWLGRRCYFPDSRTAYRAANYHVSGGAADIVKVAMNKIDEELLTLQSKMIITVHDELGIEAHESEIGSVPRRVLEIMETVYPYKYIPLTAGMEFSRKSFGDKTKGWPVESYMAEKENKS
jgi:DNA polymerase I-like protein with 3'-5' exonuclease and polymerase domains